MLFYGAGPKWTGRSFTRSRAAAWLSRESGTKGRGSGEIPWRLHALGWSPGLRNLDPLRGARPGKASPTAAWLSRESGDEGARVG